MGQIRTFLRSFAGGEISPEMFGRIDDAVFQAGAKTMRNFIARPQGPAFRRPGTRLVREVKDSNKRTRVAHFRYSTDQTMVLEFGENYIRFHTLGATLLYDSGSMVDYVGPSVVSGLATGGFSAGVNLSNSEIDFTAAHNLNDGDPIYLYQSGGAIPAPLVEGVRYYARKTGTSSPTTRIKVSATAADALAGFFITLTSVGSGTKTCARVYDPGDLVIYLGINHYCNVSTLGVVPAPAPSATAYWSTLPMSPDIYEIPSPYAEADLFDLNLGARSADVVTITHPGYAPRELRRYSATRWTLTPISFAPPLPAPTGVSVAVTRGNRQDISLIDNSSGGAPASGDELRFHTNAEHGFQAGVDYVYLGPGTSGSSSYLANGLYFVMRVPSASPVTTFYLSKIDGGAPVKGSDTTGSYSAATLSASATSISSETDHDYVVTALTGDSLESQQSATASASNNLGVAGSNNTISWTAVAGAARYNVYKKKSGIFGFIGQVDATVGTSFVDDNIGPDLGRSPPILDTTLSGTDYPGACGYFEQRRVFAGTPLFPQDVWLTRSGTESDLSYSIPVLDSDRIQFRVRAFEVSTIRHVVPLQHLILLTNSAEIRITPINSDALTPGNVSSRNQTFVGCSKVAPLVINTNVLFAEERGGHLRELGYDVTQSGYLTGDLSLRAAHLFDGLSIVDMAFQKSPLPIVWAVSSSGILLGLTYVPEQNVGAWHQHDTQGGLFESVCSVPEGSEDAVYVVVRRGSKRYVERFAEQSMPELADSYYLDCGVSQSGSASTVTGLGHLEGETVGVLADGVSYSLVVSGGQVTLPVGATKRHAGLPMTSRIETLPLSLQIDGYAQGRAKNINKVWLRCFRSRPLRVGPDDQSLVPVLSGDGLLSTSDEVLIAGSWSLDGSIVMEQADPVPTTIVGVTLEVAIGGM